MRQRPFKNLKRIIKMYMQKYLLDHKAFVIFEVDHLCLLGGMGMMFLAAAFVNGLMSSSSSCSVFFDPLAWLSWCWLIYQNIKDIIFFKKHACIKKVGNTLICEMLIPSFLHPSHLKCCLRCHVSWTLCLCNQTSFPLSEKSYQ